VGLCQARDAECTGPTRALDPPSVTRGGAAFGARRGKTAPVLTCSALRVSGVGCQIGGCPWYWCGARPVKGGRGRARRGLDRRALRPAGGALPAGQAGAQDIWRDAFGQVPHSEAVGSRHLGRQGVLGFDSRKWRGYSLLRRTQIGKRSRCAAVSSTECGLTRTVRLVLS
jgi:hypothetical protein